MMLSTQSHFEYYMLNFERSQLNTRLRLPPFTMKGKVEDCSSSSEADSDEETYNGDIICFLLENH